MLSRVNKEELLFLIEDADYFADHEVEYLTDLIQEDLKLNNGK